MTSTFLTLEDFNKNINFSTSVTETEVLDNNLIEFKPNKNELKFLSGIFLISNLLIKQEYKYKDIYDKQDLNELFFNTIINNNTNNNQKDSYGNLKFIDESQFIKKKIEEFSNNSSNNFIKKIVYNIKENANYQNLKLSKLKEIDILIKTVEEHELYKQKANIEVKNSFDNVLKLLQDYKKNISKQNDIKLIKLDLNEIKFYVEDFLKEYSNNIEEIEKISNENEINIYLDNNNNNNNNNNKIAKKYTDLNESKKIEIERKIKVIIENQQSKIKVNISTKKFVELPLEILENVRTNEEFTLSNISENSDIFLIFLSSLSLNPTINILNELIEKYQTFIKMNVIPIIVYTEKEDVLLNYFKIFNNKFELLVRVNDTNEYLRNIFKIKNDENNEKYKEFLNKNIQIENDINHNNLSAFFYIEQDKITNEFRSNNLDDLPDILKLVIDHDEEIKPKNNIQVLQRKSSIRNNSYRNNNSTKQNVNKICSNRTNLINIIKTFKKSKKEKIDINKIRVPLEHIIEHKELLKHFKLHLIKEYAVENALFIEQINYYKSVQDNSLRLQIANDVFVDFLSPNSINEINTSNKLKKKVSDVLDSLPDELPNDLFDLIKFEMVVGPLADSYTRFISTKDYKALKKDYISLLMSKSINNLTDEGN
jgi:hypothetical protein